MAGLEDEPQTSQDLVNLIKWASKTKVGKAVIETAKEAVKNPEDYIATAGGAALGQKIGGPGGAVTGALTAEALKRICKKCGKKH